MICAQCGGFSVKKKSCAGVMQS